MYIYIYICIYKEREKKGEICIYTFIRVEYVIGSTVYVILNLHVVTWFFLIEQLEGLKNIMIGSINNQLRSAAISQ